MTIAKIIQGFLIQNNHSSIANKNLELQLQIHPNYPSFRSITDTLDYFGVTNIAAEVSIQLIDQLPDCFISLITSEGVEELVLVKKQNNKIIINNYSTLKKKLTVEEFNKIWTPKVIVVESNLKQKPLLNELYAKWILFFLLLVSFTFKFLNNTINFTEVLFLLLSFSGLVLSYFALLESLGLQSQTLHKFCTSLKNASCSEIINNEKVKNIFLNLTIADSSIVFFGSLTLYQLFHGFSNVLFFPVLLGIPMVLYSLYSQFYIIKKWCAICLAIGSVTLSLVILAIWELNFGLSIDSISNLFLIFSFFTLSYLFIKEKLEENIKFKSENIALNRFRRDVSIFDNLMNSSEVISNTSQIQNEIVLGSSNPKLKIIGYTNPMCGYCKVAFESYLKILQTMGESVQIVLRIGANLEDVNSEVSQITLRLLELHAIDGEEYFLKAYEDWFRDRTYRNWISKYGVPKDTSQYIEVIKNQSKWLHENNLEYTPASIINGRVYPAKYNYDDFFFFVGVMLEEQLEKEEITISN